MFLVLKMLIDLGRLLFLLLLPGGMRRVTSEYLFMKHQLAVLSRKYMRSPNLTSADRLLIEFQNYFNQQRIHFAHKGKTPGTIAGEGKTPTINLENYRWQSYCRGLYSLPKAA